LIDHKSELIKDSKLHDSMSNVEKNAWTSFKCVTSKFLGYTKDPNYNTIVADLMENLRLLGCKYCNILI
jgi:hypothetical protein